MGSITERGAEKSSMGTKCPARPADRQSPSYWNEFMIVGVINNAFGTGGL